MKKLMVVVVTIMVVSSPVLAGGIEKEDCVLLQNLEENLGSLVEAALDSNDYFLAALRNHLMVMIDQNPRGEFNLRGQYLTYLTLSIQKELCQREGRAFPMESELDELSKKIEKKSEACNLKLLIKATPD